MSLKEQLYFFSEQIWISNVDFPVDSVLLRKSQKVVIDSLKSR